MTSNNSLLEDLMWLSWTGMETDLIFNKGVELHNFAAFPLVDSVDGRKFIWNYYEELIQIGRETGLGIILDTPTWMANPDRAHGIGYTAADLPRLTRDAVALARAAAERNPDVATRISVQIGPQGDAYTAGLGAAKAYAEYHGPQVHAAREANADLVSAYTMGSCGEAIGIAEAAASVRIPALISFTVETDGKLADGTPLRDAVTELSSSADPVAILVNCAHPEHICSGLDGGRWQAKLSGVVANASRQSHAELDAAETLDDGDPDELGNQLAELKLSNSSIRILGGCCGTDLRHLRAIALRVGVCRAALTA